MKIGEINSNNPFPGKWEVEGLYEYLKKESKWKYMQKYEPGYIIWEFTGRAGLSVYLNGKPDYRTVYLYKYEAKELWIDLSCLPIFRDHNIINPDRYRVDIIDPDEIRLYDLADVIDEPGDYWLALKLKRLRD